MLDLKKKIVIVAGGAGLLGSEIVKAIAKNNGIAVIAEPKEIRNDSLSANVDAVQLDITSKPSLEMAIDHIHKKYGKIDAFVNSAYPRNKNYGRHFFDVTYEDFCENTNIHLGGYFLASQQFAMYFSRNGGGSIINVASVYGVITPKFSIYDGTSMTMPVEYSAIKAGIIHMTKYIAQYLKGKKVRINCISPGGILNNQPESFQKNYRDYSLNKGMLSKEDLRGLFLFLLSDLSEYINGQNIIVDDGFTL